MQYSRRSIPQIDRENILLDTDAYVSVKTTRALYWDAALSNKSVEFHMGTERDFRQTVALEGRHIVAEVKPRAHNYNRIYLVYEPRTGEYSYAFSCISGDDRVKHLVAQLRIVMFENKIALKNNFVKVYGNANEVHKKQEQTL